MSEDSIQSGAPSRARKSATTQASAELLSQAIEKLENKYAEQHAAIQREADLQHKYVRWSGGLLSSVVVLSAAFGAWVLGGNLSAIRQEIRDSVGDYFNGMVVASNDEFERIETLRAQFDGSLSAFRQIQESMESLRFLQSLSDQVTDAPPLVYSRLSEIDRQVLGDQESDRDAPLEQDVALEVALLLRRAVELALAREMDPNEVFNAGMTAARLGFDAEAGRLRAIAYWLQPNTDYRIAMLASENQFGVRYEVSTGGIVPAALTAAEVRERVWQDVLILVGSAEPMSQAQVYSQAANIAERNRTDGYLASLIDAMEAVTRDRIDLVTSYTYCILSDLYTRLGQDGWRESYQANRDLCISALASESPSVPYFSPSVKSLLRVAQRFGDEEVRLALSRLQEAGVSEEWIRRALRE